MERARSPIIGVSIVELFVSDSVAKVTADDCNWRQKSSIYIYNVQLPRLVRSPGLIS